MFFSLNEKQNPINHHFLFIGYYHRVQILIKPDDQVFF